MVHTPKFEGIDRLTGEWAAGCNAGALSEPACQILHHDVCQTLEGLDYSSSYQASGKLRKYKTGKYGKSVSIPAKKATGKHDYSSAIMTVSPRRASHPSCDGPARAPPAPPCAAKPPAVLPPDRHSTARLRRASRVSLLDATVRQARELGTKDDRRPADLVVVVARRQAAAAQ